MDFIIVLFCIDMLSAQAECYAYTFSDLHFDFRRNVSLGLNLYPRKLDTSSNIFFYCSIAFNWLL